MDWLLGIFNNGHRTKSDNAGQLATSTNIQSSSRNVSQTPQSTSVPVSFTSFDRDNLDGVRRSLRPAFLHQQNPNRSCLTKSVAPQPQKSVSSRPQRPVSTHSPNSASQRSQYTNSAETLNVSQKVNYHYYDAHRTDPKKISNTEHRTKSGNAGQLAASTNMQSSSRDVSQTLQSTFVSISPTVFDRDNPDGVRRSRRPASPHPRKPIRSCLTKPVAPQPHEPIQCTSVPVSSTLLYRDNPDGIQTSRRPVSPHPQKPIRSRPKRSVSTHSRRRASQSSQYTNSTETLNVSQNVNYRYYDAHKTNPKKKSNVGDNVTNSSTSNEIFTVVREIPRGELAQMLSNAQSNVVNIRPNVPDDKKDHQKYHVKGRGGYDRGSYGTKREDNYRQVNSQPSTSNQNFHFPSDSHNNNNNNNNANNNPNVYKNNFNDPRRRQQRRRFNNDNSNNNGRSNQDGFFRKQTNDFKNNTVVKDNDTASHISDGSDKSYKNERSSGLLKTNHDHQASNKGDFKKPLFGYRRLEELLTKEPHEIISVILNPRSGFIGMIQEEVLRNKPDWLMLIFRVLSKLCSSELVDSKGAVLSSLCENNLLKHLSDYFGDVVIERRPGPLKNMATFMVDATTFFKSVIDIIPRTAKNKDFEALIRKLKVAIRSAEEDLNISVNPSCSATLETALSILKSSEKLNPEAPKRNYNDYVQSLSSLPPPNDFREISLYPTIEDLYEERAFIRPNITKGAYKDVDHYLDVQFRLLREDFISPLREGLKLFINEKTTNVKGKLKSKYDNIRLYYDVKFVGSYMDQNKVGYTVCFDKQQKFSRKMNWEYCKRFMFGSLLIFTVDHFDTFFLAIVVDRNLDNLKKGQISISIVGDENASAKAFENTYIMGESEVFFDPYYLVMKSLQTITEENFPMKNYIVNANMDHVFAPKYVEENHTWSIGRGTFDILNTEAWPLAETLALDTFQYDAFVAALTNEFVVIQGPPGTGKTFLGLKIVETMLQNLDQEFLEAPILLVCYTNHALDQFLEGILRCTDKIIRIGGQSKSEQLKNYNLRSKHVRGNISRSKDTSIALHKIRLEIRDSLSVLKQIMKERELIHTAQTVLSFKSLTPAIHPKHRQTFKNEEEFLFWLTDGHREDSSNENMLDEDGNILINDAVLDQTVSPAIQDGQDVCSNELSEEDDDDDDFENCDIYDEDETFNYNPNVCNITFAYDLRETNVIIAGLAKQVKIAKSQLKKQKINYSSYYNTYGTVNAGIKKQIKLHNILKQNLQIMQTAKSSTTVVYSEADYKSLKQVPIEIRWSLYDKWTKYLSGQLIGKFKEYEMSYRNKIKVYDELKQMEDIDVVRKARVVGITTTGAARLQTLLRTLKAKIVIIEEAAEVLESHIVVSLTKSCEHVILIGDHKQLKPSTAVYELSKRYNFDLSLFERMINNGMYCPRLNVQHRMRPEISSLIVPLIYENLHNHDSVYNFPNVLGVKKNLYFITHNHMEQQVSESMSKSNMNEVKFMIELCRYLLLQGYSAEKITILTTYTGQMYEFRKAKRENRELKEVRMIVVDKYQGEENDIILLSLVRSNSENRVGFLSIENRVCVALSRAKIGFYIIGNMECLSSASALWTNIKQTLEQQKAIGEKLTLVCQIHKIETDVSCKDDFSKVSEGGCSNLCGSLLECGHNCTSMCHIVDREHAQYKCHQPCAKSCDFNHPCDLKCYKTCGTCMTMVNRILKCGHTHSMACYYDADSFKCPTPVKVVLPGCRHECNKPCHQQIEDFRCPFPCEDRLNCGHACIKTCHKTDDPDHKLYECRKRCARKNNGCKFEHYCRKLCFEECGNCTVHVKQTMPCGHTVSLPCNTDLSGIQCFKPCDKILQCGHKCEKKCHENCGMCMKYVNKIIPTCGHEISTECWRIPDQSFCTKPCERVRPCGHRCKDICGNLCTNQKCMELVPIGVRLTCGHNKSYIYCHRRNMDIDPSSEELLQLCQEKCNVILNCKDVCSGTCGECWQGKLHKSCTEKCGNVLICGHSCEYPCREICPPCTKQCSYRCIHSKCAKQCGIPCVRCKERCTWSCDHMKCTRKCGDICNREPCYEPCKKRLQCGHDCIGFCGETCPSLCRICNKEEVTTIFLGYEDEEDARFVYLEDCKHTIESQGLEQSLSIAPEGGEITMKCCPMCKTPITKTLRFMKYVKEAYRDISRVKTKIYGNFNDIKLLHAEMVDKLSDIRNCVFKIVNLGCSEAFALLRDIEKLVKHMLDDRPKEMFVFPRHFASPKFIMDVVITNLAMRTDDITKMEEIKKGRLELRISYLLRRIIDLDFKLEAQHMDDIRAEMSRYHRLVDLYQLENTSEYKANRYMSDVSNWYHRLTTILHTLGRYDAVTHEPIVNDLYTRLKTAVKSHCGLTDEERKQINQAMSVNFNGGAQSRGHWFKCPNGHIYAITECGGAMQEAICPEEGCGRKIGGSNHRNVEGVQVASEMWVLR